MDIRYYKTALQHTIQRTGRNDWNILYFYEKQDTDMVKERIELLQEEFNHLTFTPINTEIVDYEQVLLMSLCQHNIIANSSFSWWGAWLNSNPDKKVIAPVNWFGQQANLDTSDLIPGNWIRL